MRRHEALPSKFLAKEDFDPPVTVSIVRVAIEEVQGEGNTENKPILYITGPSSPVDTTRGIVLNGINWDTCVEITGMEDCDEWSGARIEIFHDPSVRYGSRKVGGIRIRQPSQLTTDEGAFA